jgi:hypothetical protein
MLSPWGRIPLTEESTEVGPKSRLRLSGFLGQYTRGASKVRRKQKLSWPGVPCQDRPPLQGLCLVRQRGLINRRPNLPRQPGRLSRPPSTQAQGEATFQGTPERPPQYQGGGPQAGGHPQFTAPGPPSYPGAMLHGQFSQHPGGGLLRESPRWVTVAMGTQPPLLGPMEPPLHMGTGPTPPASPYGGPGHQGGGHPAGPYGHPTPPFNGQMPGSAGPPNPYMEGSMVGTVQPPPEAIQMLGLREPPVPWQSLDGTAATRRS